MIPVVRSEVTWAWLGGFTDGDGCIFLSKRFEQHPSQMHVTWSQNEKAIEILWAVHDFLTANGFEPLWYENKSNTTFRASASVWSLTIRGCGQCERLLTQLAPHLVSDAKFEKAQKALARLKGYEGR